MSTIPRSLFWDIKAKLIQLGIYRELLKKEEKTNKGTADGYAPLDENSLVPTENLGGTGADNTKYLRGDQTWQVPPGGGSTPTGTGFRHVTAGVEDAATKLVDNVDVNAGAAIVESKLSLNYATHSNANDPSSSEKLALAGTSGTPSGTNKYVTDADSRNTNARTPTSHGSGLHDGTVEATGNKGAISGYCGLNASQKVAIGNLPTGATVNDVCIGNDSRLSDARTPTAHATSHTTGADQVADVIAGSTHGLMTGADKTKLDGIATGAVADHVNIANKGTNTHSQIDTFISSKAQESGLASLNASTKVVEDPANATATPTASKIPIADASGKLDGWSDNIIIHGKDQRYFQSDFSRAPLGVGLTSNRAYFVYLGKLTQAITPKHVKFYVTSAGAGAQTAEVGFFSTTNPPNGGTLTFTKLEATGTVDDLTSTGLKKNTNAFSTSIPASTHLWAGIRTAMATTQPSIWGLNSEYGTGAFQRTDSAGALTGAGPWTGALFQVDTTVRCPDLMATLD